MARYIPKTIHTANMPYGDADLPATKPKTVYRFLTIAQQVGAESADLPRKLADALNAHSQGGPPWLTWDDELIDKVSTDSQIPSDVILSLETSGHSWLDDLLGGIAGRRDEVAVFHRVRDTIRTLAQSGHAILVGHGSTFLTRELPTGRHIRLIAPEQTRIENVARRFALSPSQSIKHMHQLDRERTAFFARFFPDRPLAPDLFDAELNTARLSQQQIIAAILAMLE
ncbi:MAG TPA: cytidylate kinase family protein [Tepidisphaeraceae bacterium]|nr:cytidylate kinase family protein [Tepidisphaeraceae bacterium]